MNKTYLSFLKKWLLSVIVLTVAFGQSQLLSAKMPLQLNDTVRTGFNALDHVLQRPLPTPVFENKHFGDHLFISLGVGSSTGAPKNRPGYYFEFSIGDWVTPVHGWRINAATGRHTVRSGYDQPAFGSVSADYLVNFSSLLRGYNSSRTFEMIGGLGLEYQRIHSKGAHSNIVGFRASLQSRFNLGSGLYMYLEPRLTVYGGDRYKGMAEGKRRFRPDIGLNLGLGYRLLRGEERRSGSKPFMNVDEDHMFFGAGGGVTVFLRDAHLSSVSPSAQVHVGKWFSSTAGLRLNGILSRYDIVSRPSKHLEASLGLDYMWNISSAFSGYRPNDLFGLNLNLGVAAAYIEKVKAKIYPGLEASLTATFRLSPNWYIYVEPQVQLFPRSFAEGAGRRSSNAVLGSAMLGLRYTIGDFSQNFKESYEKYAKSRRYFLTVGLAPSFRLRGDYGTGIAGSVGFGKRFTPVSSWRVTGDGEIFTKSPKFGSLLLSADYLCSISTSMGGYNPDRLFDVSGVIGVSGGISYYRKKVQPIGMLKLGLHGSFRLTEALDLFIEPQLNTVLSQSTGGMPGIRVMTGITYKLWR